MIGHYLLTLCQKAEAAILTGKMIPGGYGSKQIRCLVGWAADSYRTRSGYCHNGRPQHGAYTEWCDLDGWQVNCVEVRYDHLCARFGTDRINAVIRNRILANQARRALTGQREAVTA